MMTTTQVISHNYIILKQIEAEKQYQKTLNLMLLRSNWNDISSENLIERYENCLKDKPRRVYCTTFDNSDLYVMAYDPDIDYPKENIKAETIPEILYNDLLWYWGLRCEILKTLIAAKDTRFERNFE